MVKKPRSCSASCKYCEECPLPDCNHDTYSYEYRQEQARKRKAMAQMKIRLEAAKELAEMVVADGKTAS